MKRRSRVGHSGLCALLALTSACATPVGVDRLSEGGADRLLTESVLSTGTMSAPTSHLLLREGLAGRFEEDPGGTLVTLHQHYAEGRGDPDEVLFALAELSYLHGVEANDPASFLASAVYAYALLFPEQGGATLSPTDPRYRLAFDLYNRALARAFEAARDGKVTLAGGSYPLPFGAITVEVPEDGFHWSGYRLDRFAPGAEYEVRGLRNRYRWPGIGVPLSGSLQLESAVAPAAARVAPNLKIPVNGLLRIQNPRASLRDGNLQAVLEVHARDTDETVEISGQRVPLEYETTSALAYSLESAPIWDSELAGFFSGMFQLTKSEGSKDGLVMLHPYEPGKIPLVMVHGTASSMARWAELVNELENDPRVWSRYQIWLFTYNTGNPIGYSGGRLRYALEQTVASLDPQGTDPALHDMVVMGHSQGGLLTKLTAIDSGTRFWDNVSKAPLKDVKTDEKTRELLAQSMFFAPEPFVKRVIFVATPHRGSYLASFSMVGLIKDFISLPADLAGRLTDVVTANRAAMLVEDMEGMPTSLDNMTPGNRFIRTLAEIPVDPGIKAHSIIAVAGDGPIESGSDGVVRYDSAHIDGVESEKVVHSSHSTQGEPATIEEVRRILLEHAALPVE